MINTFKFLKGLIISIIYIVIILTFVKCVDSSKSGSGTENNKKQHVPDYGKYYDTIDTYNYFQIIINHLVSLIIM